MKDYYKILGLEPSDGILTIKRVFRKLALKLHPDVNKSADAKERFIEINEAYQILGNPIKRKHYDQLYYVKILGNKPKREQAYERRKENWEAQTNKSAKKGKTKGRKYASQNHKKYKQNSTFWGSNILFDIFIELIWHGLGIIFSSITD